MPIILDHFEQGTKEWRDSRVGCVTMSNAKKLLTKGKGKTLEAYLIDVASEAASGQLSDGFKSYDMERGNMLEPMAVQAYESETGEKVRRVGIGYLNEDRRIAASPDGIMTGKGIEIKCPNPKAHLRTILQASAPKEYAPQMQGGMWIFDMSEWDYVSFCPAFKPMPICIITVKRDEAMIAEIEAASLAAIEKIDGYIATAKMSVSSDLRAICDQSIDMMDTSFEVEPEIY